MEQPAEAQSTPNNQTSQNHYIALLENNQDLYYTSKRLLEKLNCMQEAVIF